MEKSFIISSKSSLFKPIGADAPLAAKISNLCSSMGASLSKLPKDIPDTSKLVSLSQSVDTLLGFSSKG